MGAREEQAFRAIRNLGWWLDDDAYDNGSWRVLDSQSATCVFDVKDLDDAEAELRRDERWLWDEMVAHRDQCLDCARHWFGYKDITGDADDAAAARHHAQHRLVLAAEEMNLAWSEYELAPGPVTP